MRKKLIMNIFLIILSTILIFTILSPINAESTKIYFKDTNKATIKNLDHNQLLSAYYWNKPNTVNLMIHDNISADTDYYKIKKAKIVFKKKIGKKTVYSTKYFNGAVNYRPKNGYKPYFAVVDYLCMVV